MKHEFTHIITRALNAVHYVDEKDNDKFKAAVLDMSNDYPQEKKIFQRTADDRFLQICSFAMSCTLEQIVLRETQASMYLEKEYLIQGSSAKEFAEIMIRGFAVYGNGEIISSRGDALVRAEMDHARKSKEPRKEKSEGLYTREAVQGDNIISVDVHDRSKSKKSLFWVCSAVIVVALCIAATVYLYNHTTVPELAGLDIDNAKSALEEHRLKYHESDNVFSDNVNRGYIISQSIEEGERVKTGTTIDVVVSKGPKRDEPAEVPNNSADGDSNSEEIVNADTVMIVYDTVLKEGKYVYCSSDAGLYKVNVQNGKKKLLMESDDNNPTRAWCFAMKKKGDWIYYLRMLPFGVGLARVNVITGEMSGLAPHDEEKTFGRYTISGENIYYVCYNLEKSRIFYRAMSLDGEEVRKANIKPLMQQKNTNSEGYEVINECYSDDGLEYTESYLKTPHKKIYLGNIDCWFEDIGDW